MIHEQTQAKIRPIGWSNFKKQISKLQKMDPPAGLCSSWREEGRSVTWTRLTPGEVRYLQDAWLPVSEHQTRNHHQVPADSVAVSEHQTRNHHQVPADSVAVSKHQPRNHHQVPADTVAAVGDEVHCQLFSILLPPPDP